MAQPAATNDQGVILTLGINVNGDRAAIVLPIAIDSSTPDKNDLCADAVQSAIDSMIGFWTGSMSDAAYFSFCSAEGMVNGYVPARKDFDPTDFPGTLVAISNPSQVALLMRWYADASFAPPGRMKVAKTYLPGIPQTSINGDVWDDGIVGTGIRAILDKMYNGWNSTNFSGSVYRRYLATPRPRTPGTPLIRIFERNYDLRCSTQKRRLQPIP
jgi:hypothetical protein